MPQDGKKMIFDRIQLTENFFGDLCSELSSFTKKKARFGINIFICNLSIINFNGFFAHSSRLRDKYDELAHIFKGYADTARFNETLFNGLLNYSKSCTFLADIKDMEVQRLQSKVNNHNFELTHILSDRYQCNFKLILLKILRDVANYENVCKNARESMKHSLLARGKEQLKSRNQQRNSVCDFHLNSLISPFVLTQQFHFVGYRLSRRIPVLKSKRVNLVRTLKRI